jgi:hypothetical protein
MIASQTDDGEAIARVRPRHEYAALRAIPAWKSVLR